METNSSAAVEGQRALTAAIVREIDALHSLGGVDVVIIFVPLTWEAFEHIEDSGVTLDLHDYVKAYCAQVGVRTQFIRSATPEKRQQCEVLWWLAQAIYAKALRTPFVLAADPSESVSVGIGYGTSRRGSGVVLGCSHVFDANGRGLRYQLSRIENPVWFRKNPYLSRDDAVRVGLQTRQLFFEAYRRLPARVVIHKRTHFRRDEIEGLAQALAGVEELDMLTIEFEPSWRFLAWNKLKKAVHMFPVKRGTALLLGPHEVLLWAHGTVEGLDDSSRCYFQGKTRIPAPLRITRHAGHAPIERVARELLGLSKMDWNTFDLYSKLPVTLETSGTIARVGQLLSRLGPETLDYRLFM